VNHSVAPAELTKVGADIEARVLARAVRWHAERRVILNGAKVCAALTLCLSYSDADLCFLSSDGRLLIIARIRRLRGILLLYIFAHFNAIQTWPLK
jgi:hypothetical protein